MMASYVVMEPPESAAEDAVPVRDGFAFFAFLVPFLWFLWHRMWIEALAALAAALALGALGAIPGWATASTIISFCLSVFLGLEARGFRVAALGRRGWKSWGVVEASSRDEAELRYLTERYAPEERSNPVPTLPPAASNGKGEGPALGLFAYPGAR